MTERIYQVDAFTTVAFAGNPAAVCLLEAERSETWMLAVAAEMNLSETAFLRPLQDGYSLRWFTPTTEVKFCGHATLASAHILWDEGIVDPETPARFHTKSGVLTTVLQQDGIVMDFPAAEVRPGRVSPLLLEALGVTAMEVWQSGDKQLIVVDGEEQVRQLSPDFGSLRALEERGVMVTSESSSTDFDFVSRYFAPWIGIDEDPVTGSAHCILGPFWANRLGKSNLRAFQASPRGGAMNVRPAGERVYLQGKAVTVLAGELRV